jgi:hypothetical protein
VSDVLKPDEVHIIREIVLKSGAALGMAKEAERKRNVERERLLEELAAAMAQSEVVGAKAATAFYAAEKKRDAAKKALADAESGLREAQVAWSGISYGAERQIRAFRQDLRALSSPSLDAFLRMLEELQQNAGFSMDSHGAGREFGMAIAKARALAEDFAAMSDEAAAAAIEAKRKDLDALARQLGQSEGTH